MVRSAIEPQHDGEDEESLSWIASQSTIKEDRSKTKKRVIICILIMVVIAAALVYCVIALLNDKLFAYLEEEENQTLKVDSMLCSMIDDTKILPAAQSLVNSVTTKTSRDNRVRVLIEAYFHIRDLSTGKSMGSLPLISDLKKTKLNETKLNYYYGAHAIQFIDTGHIDNAICKLIILSQCIQLQLLLSYDIDDALIVTQIGADMNYLTYKSEWKLAIDLSDQQQQFNFKFGRTNDSYQFLCANPMWLDGFTRPQNEFNISLEVRQLQLELQTDKNYILADRPKCQMI